MLIHPIQKLFSATHVFIYFLLHQIFTIHFTNHWQQCHNPHFKAPGHVGCWVEVHQASVSEVWWVPGSIGDITEMISFKMSQFCNNPVFFKCALNIDISFLIDISFEHYVYTILLSSLPIVILWCKQFLTDDMDYVPCQLVIHTTQLLVAWLNDTLDKLQFNKTPYITNIKYTMLYTMFKKVWRHFCHWQKWYLPHTGIYLRMGP